MKGGRRKSASIEIDVRKVTKVVGPAVKGFLVDLSPAAPRRLH
jgi:hypothetical protein